MKPIIKNFVLVTLMVAASGLAIAMRPTQKIADMGPPVKLETMIPKAFGEWREEPQNQTLIVDPQQQETINRIYTETLSRTYINPEGYRVMLSIAYGTDQGDAKQAHRPEVCYPSQGFVIKDKYQDQLTTINGSIPVKRLQTQLGQRHEPVTYWMTVGDRVVLGGLEKKAVEVTYGIRGNIPDGLLFRVSSIDPTPATAFRAHNSFINQLLKEMTPESALKVFGNLASSR